MTAKLPPEYFECAHKMDAAAHAWMKAHPFAEPRFTLGTFEAEMKRHAGRPEHENVAIAASLLAVIDKIAGNEDARQLLLAMDEASGKQATYMQAKALIELQFEAAVARNQGQLTGPGDWRCPCCSQMLDGFTNLGFDGDKPAPGSITVCAYCFGRLEVKEEGGYRGLTDADVAAMPRPAQRSLERAGELVRKMAKDRKRRS